MLRKYTVHGGRLTVYLFIPLLHLLVRLQALRAAATQGCLRRWRGLLSVVAQSTLATRSAWGLAHGRTWEASTVFARNPNSVCRLAEPLQQNSSQVRWDRAWTARKVRGSESHSCARYFLSFFHMPVRSRHCPKVAKQRWTPRARPKAVSRSALDRHGQSSAPAPCLGNMRRTVHCRRSSARAQRD